MFLIKKLINFIVKTITFRETWVIKEFDSLQAKANTALQFFPTSNNKSKNNRNPGGPAVQL